ncbi:FAD-binding oxidoreductase [soil metagenome]
MPDRTESASLPVDLDRAAVLARFREAIGAAQVIDDAAGMAGYLTDWRRRYTGLALAVLRPGNTGEVAALVRICAEHRIAIVPQGGNTSLVGGAVPDTSGRSVVITLNRMQAVRAVDLFNNTMTVEAGCILQNLQQAARASDRLFPLSLAAEGSCTIGGNLGTNAGGTQVLRYGNARELCLGLEVVTPSGDVWDGLSGLRKDNTGYDLRDLFIGAEGTLGIITAACVKVHPLPRSQTTALCALSTIDQALGLLELAQVHCGPNLTAFELMSEMSIGLVEKHFEGQRLPFAARHAQYALLEISDHESEAHTAALFESLMTEAFERELIDDAVIAQSITQSRALWQLREHISEAQAHEGKNIKHDISVPISQIGRFVHETDALLQQHSPGLRMVTFGHLGDGNLHYNVSPPLLADGSVEPEAQFLQRQDGVYELVHDQVARFGGSISAEHGIGQLKFHELERYKSPVALALMRSIKHALDPLGIMNPCNMI